MSGSIRKERLRRGARKRWPLVGGLPESFLYSLHCRIVAGTAVSAAPAAQAVRRCKEQDWMPSPACVLDNWCAHGSGVQANRKTLHSGSVGRTTRDRQDGMSKHGSVIEAMPELAETRPAVASLLVFSLGALPDWSFTLAVLAGAALRLFFILLYSDFDGDSEVYGTIAKNLLLHHAYALDGPFRPTLIRMPGYPAFMAVVFSFCSIKNYVAVRYAQAIVDMATCLLIAQFVRDYAGRRASLVALWIACLCPFTADYVATPLTETPEIFCVALAMLAAGRLVRTINGENVLAGLDRHSLWLCVTAAALIGAIAFRPDGALLAATIIPGIWWYTRKRAPRAGLRAAALIALLTVLPIIPWTIRNYRVFHVIQPLAPRSAMDPTEIPLDGFNLWTTTWEADFVSLGEIWWRGDDLPIDIQLLPARAFDSREEYRQTAALIADYNNLCTIPAEMDVRFANLARQRIERHPSRQYVVLPMVRLADMWLRPRTEYLEDLPMRWWEWRLHPEGSVIAIAYALLNALFLAVAAFGFVKRRLPFQAMLLAYVLLRCAVLWGMPNAEPRYTLEAFPMLMVAAALALCPNWQQASGGAGLPAAEAPGRTLRQR